ncbi:MAG: hypothetical protein HUJ54_07490 [Erysipelotrichaceae bacterium]|nr:hypothetical protein [Erysipelotrichaceae bacterium]
MKKILLASLAALAVLAGCSAAPNGLNSETKKVDFNGISLKVPADAQLMESAPDKEITFADYRIPCSKDYDLYLTFLDSGDRPVVTEEEARSYVNSFVLEELITYELVKEEKISGFESPLYVFRIDSSPEAETESTYPYSYYLLIQGKEGTYIISLTGDFSDEIDQNPKKEVIAALKPEVEKNLDTLLNSVISSLTAVDSSGTSK